MKSLAPNVGEWWADYAKQVQSFKNKDSVVGTVWPLQYNVLTADNEPVEVVKPIEGTTGWSDTWMIASNAQNPNCMYLWMNHMMSPEAQAIATEGFGEAPVNLKACDLTKDPNHCDDVPRRRRVLVGGRLLLGHPAEDCGDDGCDDVRDAAGLAERMDGDQGLATEHTDPVTSVPHGEPPPRSGLGRRLSTFFHRHPRVGSARCSRRRSAGCSIGYLGSLVRAAARGVLGHGRVHGRDRPHVHARQLPAHLRAGRLPRRGLAHDPDGRRSSRSPCAVLAFPIAYYMARVASPRTRNLLVVAVLMPLWASYLVKAYAWRTILSDNGVINWALEPLGLSFDGYSTVGLWLVFTYLWLPFMILPIYAGLERIPSSLLEASADLGGRSVRTFFRVTLPLVFPAVVAGSIFTFSLTLGDYIAPVLITSEQFIGTVIYAERGVNLPGRRRLHVRADRRHDRLPARRAATEGVRGAVTESRLTRVLLRLGAGLTLAFIYLPLILVAVYAFNESVTQRWPIENFSTKWFSVAYHDPDVRDALWLSVRAALGATAVALVLGTLLSLGDGALLVLRARNGHAARDPPDRAARHHHRARAADDIHDGRHDYGLRRSSSATRRSASSSSSTTRSHVCGGCTGNLEEASKDLGADSWQTFRYVTFPQMRTALLAGGLLAFALSWDEVVVTIFTSGAEQTLPIWIFANLFRPVEQPIVNVVALFVIVVSIVIPVYIAQRLSAGAARGVPGGEK